MTETKLKPCPFCGSQAGILKSDDVFPRFIAICGNRVCQEQPSVEADLLEGAIALWNTRPIEDELNKEIKRLREALEIYKEALHEGLWKTGLQDSIWEIIEQAEEKAEQILKGGEE